MAFEVVAYGLVSVWLLGLLPAAVVTLAKERWLLFAIGWVTFGIAWFAGAIPLAEPGSWWARRFYGEKRTARATDPVRHRRSAKAVALWIGGSAVLVLVVGLIAARPTPLTGVGGRALQYSVGGALLEPSSPCHHQDGGEWRCHAYDREVSSAFPYRVKMHGLGCWTAIPSGPGGERFAERRSGCITAWDLLRPL